MKKLTPWQKDFFQKWVDALRSRKYKQTKGWLKHQHGDEIGHCCLGVACDLYNPKKWNSGTYRYGTKTHSTGLPTNLQKKIGLSNKDESDLICMNDGGKKFYQIARWLERRYLK